MKLEVFNMEGQKTGREVELPAEIFGIEPNQHAVYLTVKQYLANQRQGTHKAKERSEIRGSTRKLHKQKGTGGARKGDIKSPVLRGGGRVFGPRPRDYSFSLNKKVKRLAKLSALSSKASEGSILVIEDFSFETPKTKTFIHILDQLQATGKRTLLVTQEYDKNVYLSARNIQRTEVSKASDLHTYAILNAGKLIFSESGLKSLVEEL